MIRLLDVNVLLALLWENHEQHERALATFDEPLSRAFPAEPGLLELVP